MVWLFSGKNRNNSYCTFFDYTGSEFDYLMCNVNNVEQDLKAIQ